MVRDGLLIGEVARQSGATRKALRLYRIAMNASASTKKNQPSGCST